MNKNHKHQGRHKVKAHKWNSGILDIVEHIFETFEEAIEWCENAIADSFKIYDSNGQLIYSGDLSDIETSA